MDQKVFVVMSEMSAIQELRVPWVQWELVAFLAHEDRPVFLEDKDAKAHREILARLVAEELEARRELRVRWETWDTLDVLELRVLVALKVRAVFVGNAAVLDHVVVRVSRVPMDKRERAAK